MVEGVEAVRGGCGEGGVVGRGRGRVWYVGMRWDGDGERSEAVVAPGVRKGEEVFEGEGSGQGRGRW